MFMFPTHIFCISYTQLIHFVKSKSQINRHRAAAKTIFDRFASNTLVLVIVVVIVVVAALAAAAVTVIVVIVAA